MTFRGFGRNWPTLALIVLIAFVLSALFLPVSPLVDKNKNQASAATWPCKPHSWQYAWHTDTDSGFGWSIQQHYQIKDNGCDVFVVASTHSCLPGASLTFNINPSDCSSIRRYTTTAYGEYIVVRSAFKFSPWITIGFANWQHFICRYYNREGQPFAFYRGPQDYVANDCLYQ